MANIVHSRFFTNYVIILIGYLIALGSWIYNSSINFTFNGYGYSVGIGIAQLAGLYLLINSGTFKKTKYAKYARIGIAIIIIGALFKILHLAGSEYIVTAGYAVILMCYTLSFVNKPFKKAQDLLKLIYAFALVITVLSKFFHLSLANYSVIPAIIMIIMVLLHIKEQQQMGYPEDVTDNFRL